MSGPHTHTAACACRQLQSLSITGVPRLRDKALGPLAGLNDKLQHLDLSGCSGVTSKSLAVLGQLTALHSLVLTGKDRQDTTRLGGNSLASQGFALAHTAGSPTCINDMHSQAQSCEQQAPMQWRVTD